MSSTCFMYHHKFTSHKLIMNCNVILLICCSALRSNFSQIVKSNTIYCAQVSQPSAVRSFLLMIVLETIICTRYFHSISGFGLYGSQSNLPKISHLHTTLVSVQVLQGVQAFTDVTTNQVKCILCSGSCSLALLQILQSWSLQGSKLIPTSEYSKIVLLCYPMYIHRVHQQKFNGYS